MKKSKLLNLSVADNTNARVVPSMIIGEPAGYVSGDVLDANATSSLIDEKIGEIDTEALSTLQEDVDSIKEVLGTDSEDLTDTIDTFNEIQQFLSGVDNTTTLNQILNGKINNPPNGSVGQVLTKTANGVEWDDASGGIANETDPVFTASPAADITASDIIAWDAKQDALTFDSTPTASSTNPVTSGGIKSSLDTKANVIDVYTKAEIGNLVVPTNTDIVVVSDISEIVNPQTNTIYRVAGNTSYADWGYDGTELVKLAEYAFSIDDVPTAGSNNTVKSGGVYQAIQGASSRSLDAYQAILENFVPVEESGFYFVDENLYIGAYLNGTSSSGFGGSLTYSIV